MSKERASLLFVDDEETVLAGIRRLLFGETQTWDMTFAASVDEALQTLAEEDIDVVIADIMMPGRDGFDLLREMRGSERTKDVPVVMLTGVAEDDIKSLACFQGATDLLTKPVSRVELLARIRSVLRLRELTETLDQKVGARTRELQHRELDVVWRLAQAGEYHDEFLGSHVTRVGCYSMLLARGLGLPGDFANRIFRAAPLHDVGKIGIPEDILRKPGRLTREERRLMEKHCEIGADILRREPKGQGMLLWYAEQDSPREWTRDDNPLLQMAVSIALGHHERWDGHGYPAKRAGEDIPVEARIAHLADVYDALIFKRPYKPALPEEEVLSIIRDGAGRQFDPLICRIVEDLVEPLREIRMEFCDETCAAS